MGQRRVVRPADHGAARPARAERRARPPGHPAGRGRRPPPRRRQGRAPGRAGPDHAVQGPARGGPDRPPPRARPRARRPGRAPPPARRAGRRPDDDNPDVRYWREQVEPLVDGRRVRWVGTVHGAERDNLVATAAPPCSRSTGRSRAAPPWSSRSPSARRSSGTAAAACPSSSSTAGPGCWSTPATRTRWRPQRARRRRWTRSDCRREAARRFTPARMADRYLRLYEKVLARSGRPLRVHDAARNGA